MPSRTEAKVEEARRIVQLVVFRVGDEEFAIRIEDVREIIQAGAIIPVPDAPRFVTGVANVRGEIAAVISLARRFSLPAPKKRAATTENEVNYIIITEQEKNLFGMFVDELIEVLRIADTDIKSAPDVVTKAHGEYIVGVVTREDRLIILLDIGRVLSEEELEAVADVHQRHQDNQQAAEPSTSEQSSDMNKPENTEEETQDEENPDRG